MKKIFKAATLVMIATLVMVTMNYCNKTRNDLTVNDNDQDYQELIKKSKAMQEHILAFKAKMKYYRDNPGIKSSEKQYVLETIIDWESTLNLTYCNAYESVINIASKDTIISIPIQEGDSMRFADVSDRYYNAILAAVQNQYYVDAPFTNQVLLAVDLEPVNSLDSVKVVAYIGNKQVINFPEYDWLFGELGGTCVDQFYYGELDAAKQAAITVRSFFYEEPPIGQQWGFTFIDTYESEPLDMENGVLIYINPEDTDGENNNYDYLIFFANDNVDIGITEEIECLESSTELNFYKFSYIDLTQGWIDDSNGKKFMLCDYSGKDYGTIIQHELETQIGNRIITSVNINLPPIY